MKDNDVEFLQKNMEEAMITPDPDGCLKAAIGSLNYPFVEKDANSSLLKKTLIVMGVGMSVFLLYASRTNLHIRFVNPFRSKTSDKPTSQNTSTQKDIPSERQRKIIVCTKGCGSFAVANGADISIVPQNDHVIATIANQQFKLTDGEYTLSQIGPSRIGDHQCSYTSFG